ncbi:MAG: secretin N-terminal domain-containing protein [Nitrospirota bacterium]
MTGRSARRSWTRGAAWLVVFVLAVGCTPRSVRVADQFAREGNWDGAILIYQEAVAKRPDDAALQDKFNRAKEQAAKRHHERGEALLEQQAWPQAVEALKQAVALAPNTEAYRVTLSRGVKLKDAEDRYQAGLQLLKTEKYQDATREFERAVELSPSHAGAAKAIADTRARKKLLDASDELTLTSTQPITLRFQNAKLKEVFDLLSKTSGVNFLFDRDIRDDPITIFVKNTTFRDALNLVLTTNNLFMKRVAADTILILPKTKQKIDQYQDLMIRTFYLSSAKAKDMVNLLRTMLETRRMFVNEDLNTIVMRDTPDKIRLAEKIIEANDRQGAEVMFEVEVLEISRNHTIKYGWNFFRGDQAGASANLSLKTNPLTLDALQEIGRGEVLITLPSVLVNFIKLDSNAKTLANPKVRVLDNKSAKINIGDKVPIQLSTTTSAPATATSTGVPTTTQTTEFKDVGIKLEIKPSIRLNNDVTMDLKLDVTSIGDLDPQAKQFRFGTRTTDTTINVRDGETVVLGGMIRDEDRKSMNKVPILGDLPILGKLFSSTDTQKVKTDVVLTITPHVIRGLSAPDGGVQSFWSGTEEGFATQPLFTPSEAVSQPSNGGPGETVPMGGTLTAPSSGGASSPTTPGRSTVAPPPPSRQGTPPVVFPVRPDIPAPSTAQ